MVFGVPAKCPQVTEILFVLFYKIYHRHACAVVCMPSKLGLNGPRKPVDFSSFNYVAAYSSYIVVLMLFASLVMVISLLSLAYVWMTGCWM